MHYITYLALEGFFVRLLAPNRPGPICVLRDNLVLDMNADARARGIVPGMEKRTARAIAHETHFLAWQEDAFEEAQTQWLDLCTQFTGIIEPEEQNSAYLDLSSHPNPVDVAEKLVRTLAQETGHQIFYGSSRSKWLAKLAAQMGDGGTAVTDPARFLSSLPIAKLTPVNIEHRQRLMFLGYRTIGDISTIPGDVLRQQFGADGLFIAKAARGEFMPPVRAIYPRDSIIENLFFDGSVESLEAIDHALMDLATRAAKRLSEKDLQGQELALSIRQENNETQTIKRRFSKPIYNLPGALSALRILFQATQDSKFSSEFRVPSSPLDASSIASLHVRLANLLPRKEKQVSILGRSKTDSAVAVTAVRTAFGDASVQLGAEIAIPRRVKVLREWKNAIGWS